MRTLENILLLIIALWMLPIMPVVYLLSRLDEYVSKDDSPIC
jgi:hypothetical protein